MHDLGVGLALLLGGGGLGFEDAGLAQARGGGLGGGGFGEHLFGGGLALGGGLLGLGLDEDHLGATLDGFLLGIGMADGGDDILLGLELGGLLGGLGGLDVLDEGLLGLLFGGGDGDLLLAVGRGEGLGILDALLFADDGLLDLEPFADDVLNLLLLDLDLALLGDAGEGDDALAFGGLDEAVLLDAFALDAVGAFLVALGDDDLTVLVFLGDLDFLLDADAGLFGAEALFLLDLLGFGLFAGGDGGDLALLLLLGFGELAVEFEDGLPGCRRFAW
ncbi:MAG: hypothetical protein M5U12_02670 [Verrucomicrobia bacterium]|nr:hypothetical protein [Verrucomicrobiota bacterium]